MRVQGPGTNEFKQSYWSKALNWSQDQFRGGSKTKKWQIEANMAPVLEGKSIGSDRKKSLYLSSLLKI
jgi:hypothetical protein